MKKSNILWGAFIELMLCVTAMIDLILFIPFMVWNVLWAVICGIRCGDMRGSFNTVFDTAGLKTVANLKAGMEHYLEVVSILEEES